MRVQFTKDKQKLAWLQVDWSKFLDEDDEAEAAAGGGGDPAAGGMGACPRQRRLGQRTAQG